MEPTISTTKPLTVTDYAARIQVAVKSAGPAIVEGEVQKPKTTGGGAFMFDFTDGESTLRGKVLPWVFRDGITHVPREGDLVRLAVSKPDFWPKGNLLTLVADDIELAGDGELLRRRRELLERLRREGLTDTASFKSLPPYPSTIGVIAGKGSSGLEDVLRALRDRFPAARVITACCQVQGAGAPAAIIDSLARLDMLEEVDVIIVSRGGGSPRDLMAFDDEGVCRAMHAVETPVVAAIGHTDNEPVCNFVTHSALTPSRVADLVVPDRTMLFAGLDEAQAAQDRAVGTFRTQAEDFELRVQGLRGRPLVEAWQRRISEAGRVIDTRAAAFIGEVSRDLSDAREQIATALPRVRADLLESDRGLAEFRAAVDLAARRPAELRREIDDLGERLAAAVKRVMRAEKTDYLRALDRLSETLFTASRHSLRRSMDQLGRDGAEMNAAGRRTLRRFEREVHSQAEILKASDYRDRGWLLASDPEGRTITSAAEVAVGDKLKLHMRDGEVGVRAEESNVNDKE